MTGLRLRAAAVAAVAVLAGSGGASAATGPQRVATSPHVYNVAESMISPNGRYVAVTGWDAPPSCSLVVSGCSQKYAIAVYDLVKHKTHVIGTGLSGAGIYGVSSTGSVVYSAYASPAAGMQYLVQTAGGKVISPRALLPKQYSFNSFPVDATNVLTDDGTGLAVFVNGAATQPLMLNLRTHKLWLPALYHHRLFGALAGQPSGDGKRMIFTNIGEDKVLPHPPGHTMDVYVRDATRNHVKLITGGIGSGDDLYIYTLSFDHYGRYAAISYSQQQRGPVVFVDTNVPDGYQRFVSVIDTHTGRVVVTVPTANGDANTGYEADEGHITGDGRFLIYRSQGSPSDHSGGQNGIMRLNLQSGQVTQVNPMPVATACGADCVATAVDRPTSDLHGSDIAFIDGAPLSADDADAYADAYVVKE